MNRRVRQKWSSGDCFLVPLVDQSHSLGQIISEERGALNSVICAFFRVRVEGPVEGATNALLDEDLISVLFTSRDKLDDGSWVVIRRLPVFDVSRHVDLADLRRKNYVGTKVIGSANVRQFLDAFFGLAPWNAFADPKYFDKLLVSGARSDNLIFK